MQVNLHKPYGLVMNHPSIRYEQDGKTFDFAGRLIGPGTGAEQDEPEQTVAPAAPRQLEPGERDFVLEQARAFLKHILAEGPVRRAAVYSTANTNNQDWEKVKQAFQEIGVEQKLKNSVYWKLNQG